jgi:hypothetical protein
VHVQVKTLVPGGRTCSVGLKSEKNYGENSFSILGGIPGPGSKSDFVYFIIPSSVMAKEISEAHRVWRDAPGKNGQEHNDNTVRTVTLPPYKSITGCAVSEAQNRWDLIEQKLLEQP